MSEMQHVRVGDAKNKGQGLFARHELSTKHPIYTIDEPALIAISTAELSNFCYSCYAGSRPVGAHSYSIGQYRDAHLQVCTGCQVVRFCGRSCQARAWKSFHKLECKTFARLKPKGVLPETARALLRFILQKDKGLLPDATWAQVLNLESHMKDLAKAGDEWMDLMLISKACKEYSGTDIDSDILLRVLCILKINAMVLTTTFGDEIGVFLDPVLAKMNHNCDGGNVFIQRPVYTNHTGWLQKKSAGQALMRLVPNRMINSDEELTITYIEHTDSLQKRQDALRKQYMFHCNCDRCKADGESSAELSNNNPGLATHLQEWSNIVGTTLATLTTNPTARTISDAITALTKVVDAMEQEANFQASWHPYSQAIHELKLLHMNNYTACDKALICALKEVLLVSPVIYQSPLDPRRIIHTIYVLQILGLLADTYSSSQVSNDDILEQRKKIESMGFSRASFTYWRLKLCVDTRKALLESPAEDLAAILEMEQTSTGVNNRNEFERLLGSEAVKLQVEEETRKLLDITTERWQSMIAMWEP